jgi:outer membrane protein assembly factor BamB
VNGANPARLLAFLCLPLFLFSRPAAGASREGVRIRGEIAFRDMNGDGVDDWLVGRADCFTKAEGEAEVSAQCVALIDGATWSPLWRKNVPRFGPFPPVVAGKWIAIDVGEPVFSAFDSGRSELFWEFRMDGEHSRPMVPVGNRILLTVGGDHIYFVDPEERRPLWDQRLWSPVELAPVVVGQNAAFVTARELVVFDLADGRTVWKLRGHVTSIHPAPHGGLYLAYTDGDDPHSVAAVSVASGERRWRRDFVGRLTSPLLVGQDHLYAFTRRQIIALDRESGAVSWRARLSHTPKPLGSDKRVVLALLEPRGAPQEVHAFDRETGKRLWTQRLSGRRFERQGWLAGGILVLWSRETTLAEKGKGRVQGFSAEKGAPLWNYDLSERILEILSVDVKQIRLQRERGFTWLDTEKGTELASRRAVSYARVEKPLSDRLRYLVYALPPLLVVTGVGVWIRRRMRRGR